MKFILNEIILCGYRRIIFLISMAIHSHKGGVGKTTISVNMAVLLAKAGMNVCLIDYDFSMPNLFTFFDFIKIPFLNEFFWGDRKIEECLYNAKEDLGLKGDLWIGLANPATDAVNMVLELDSNGAMKMLHDSLKLKSLLSKKPYLVDHLIFDTTPGLGLITLNSFIATENILIIIKFSNSDIQGTIQLISGILDSLNSEIGIIANNIPKEYLENNKELEIIEQLVVKDIEKNTGADVNFLGWLQYDESLLKTEFSVAVKNLKGESNPRLIHALNDPNHPLVKTLQGILSEI